jgi:hypothetical protein
LCVSVSLWGCGGGGGGGGGAQPNAKPNAKPNPNPDPNPEPNPNLTRFVTLQPRGPVLAVLRESAGLPPASTQPRASARFISEPAQRTAGSESAPASVQRSGCGASTRASPRAGSKQVLPCGALLHLLLTSNYSPLQYISDEYHQIFTAQ